jgi:hypothetical protein
VTERQTPSTDHEHGHAVLQSLPVLATTHTTDGSGTYTGVYTGLQVKSTQSPKELVGRPLADVLNPEATETLLATIDEASETGDRQYVEFPVYFGDERFWRGAFVTPLNTDDASSEVVVASFDLTRHEERTDALYDVFGALETYRSRRELEQGICDRLLDHRRYEMAWLGTFDSDGELVVRATADADDYLDGLRDAGCRLETVDDPGIRALRSQEPVSVVPIDSTDGAWATVAADHGLQAGLALPLSHDGVDHGVLAVYLAEAEYLVPWREDVLVDYADAAGYALSAAMWQWELSSSAATVLEADIRGPVSLTELCVHSDYDALEVISVVPRVNETVYYLDPLGDDFHLDGTVEQCDGIGPYGEDGVRAVVVEGETPERRLVGLGAQIRSFRVTTDESTLTLAVPSSTVARSVRKYVQEAYTDAGVTVQWGSGDHGEATPLSGSVSAVMTDRQYEILTAAYRHGYFERDPAVNLSDLADMLDVSRWTVSEHLRVAQREMLSELLE